MKILFVGEIDDLSAAILRRLRKEDNDIFFLHKKTPLTKKKEFRKYHNYVWPETREDVRRILLSIVPDVIIYEGIGFLDVTWNESQRENLSILSMMLEEGSKLETCKFMLLSFVQCSASKEMLLQQEESMAELYSRTRGLEVVILRLAQVYGNEICVGADDWLGELAGVLVAASELEVEEEWLQPVHVSDVADAVVRVLGVNDHCTNYTICGTERIAKSDIVRMMAQELCPDVSIEITETNVEEPVISNAEIKKEKEWVELWPWKRMVDEKQFTYSYIQKNNNEKAKDQNVFKSVVRKTIENIVIFAAFCLAFFLTKDHSLFSQVDWLLIYVVVVSLAYGVKQSTFAVVLASAAYLISQGKNIIEMTNFYSYAGSVLMIVEFLFFGIVVGYSVDMLRETVRNYKNKLTKLGDAYDKLEQIDDKNILIKNAYEKRVLDAKTSLPKLYSIINKITVLDVNRIFMEILHVVQELMQTDTVAVYRVSENSSYLRLIASLNKESIMEGNSWNLKNNPDIEQAIRQNELYEGDIWKKEPAIVLPVGSSKGCEAAIVIKELPLEAHSLYSINLLRTLLSLISDSINKALQHDLMVREQRYHKDTNILYYDEFKKAVALAEEKKQNELAESCIIKVQLKGSMTDTYHQAEKIFREMDIWGSDEEGNLYVLLGNTSMQDARIVLDRLEKNGIRAQQIENFN